MLPKRNAGDRFEALRTAFGMATGERALAEYVLADVRAIMAGRVVAETPEGKPLSYRLLEGWRKAG